MKLKAVQWKFAILLGLFALVRPIIKTIADFNNKEVSPTAVMVITLIIAAVWITVAVRARLASAVSTLAAAGFIYAGSSIAMAVVIQTMFPEHRSDEATIAQMLTAGLIASAIFNALYGALLGLIAQQLMPHPKKH
ncbi:MAG TPA: hypothetical protein VLA92_00145 [Candidatus Saccharimonadales bacterium]|nr:hypothetical protein [Candidatus Saccharimonadales bacterium]